MTSPMLSGIGSGIDLQSIVTQLMAAERSPEQKMTTAKTASLQAQTAWTAVGTQLATLQSAAESLNTLAEAQGATSTSSDSTVFSTTAGPGAQPGVSTVQVLRLATAQQQTTGALSSPSMLVGAGQAVISAGLGALGGSGLAITGSTTTGSHTITVMQGSAAAHANGTSAPALTFAPGSNDLTITLADSSTATVTLGTYATNDDMLADINAQLGGVGSAQLVAGQLQISSRDEGSAATLTVSGGALSALGLTAGTTSGTDARVSLDGATPVTVTHVDTGSTVTLANGVSFTTGTHLGGGSSSFDVIRTDATSTLADLNAQLNAAGSPVAAAVINTGDGSATPYRLVLTARGTGTAGALSIETSGINVLDSGQLTEVNPAVDAQLKIGGATITRSSNSVSDVIQGVTLNLAKTGTATVSVGTDPAATSTKVKALVDALNGVLNNISQATAYNSTTKTGGPLSGESLARQISYGLLDDVLNAAGTGTTKVLSQLGIQTTRNGTITFDATAFAAAMTKDPDGVASLVSGFAKTVGDYAKSATAFDGVVTNAGKAAGADAASRQSQIDAFEVRMTALQASYQAKFAALDATLGSLKQQQSALSSALSGL